jgi:hypothetical protein
VDAFSGPSDRCRIQRLNRSLLMRLHSALRRGLGCRSWACVKKTRWRVCWLATAGSLQWKPRKL